MKTKLKYWMLPIIPIDNHELRYSLSKSIGRSPLPTSNRYNKANCVAMPPLHRTWIQFRWPPSLKSASSFFFREDRNFVTFDPVMKNTTRAIKWAKLESVRIKPIKKPTKIIQRYYKILPEISWNVIRWEKRYFCW